MKAKIIKKIVIQDIDLPDGTPIYREAVRYQLQALYVGIKDGEMPDIPATFNEKIYERLRLVNPETKLVENFYVEVNEHGLWDKLVAVSDGFINYKIRQGIRSFEEDFLHEEIPKIERRSFDSGVMVARSQFRDTPWYKRLFYPLLKEVK